MENWELPEAVDYDMILKAIHTAIDKLKQNESVCNFAYFLLSIMIF